MHRVTAMQEGRGDDVRDVQVAVPWRRPAYAHAVVGHTHRQAIGIGLAVGHHGFDAEFPARPDDPHGDLAAIRDQDPLEHASGLSRAPFAGGYRP